MLLKTVIQIINICNCSIFVLQIFERVRCSEPPAGPDALGAAERRTSKALRPHVVLDEADHRRKTPGKK